MLGTAGFNTTFPSVEDEGRLSFGYTREALRFNIFYNYLGGYLNWSGTAAVQPTRVAGLPDGGGGDPVDSFATVDANVAYSVRQHASCFSTRSTCSTRSRRSTTPSRSAATTASA